MKSNIVTLVSIAFLMAGCASAPSAGVHTKQRFCDSLAEYRIYPFPEDTPKSARALSGLNDRINLYCGELISK